MNMNRRCFLSLLGASAASLAFPAFSFADIERGPFEQTELLMGTIVTIKAHSESQAKAFDAVESAFSVMRNAEAELTRHAAGQLTKFNESGRLSGMTQHLRNVLQLSQRIGILTERSFDPTVLPVLELLEKSGGRHISAAEREEAAELCGFENIKFSGDSIRAARQGMKITLDGIAKGYITDLAAAEMKRCGISDFLINSGGDLTACGDNAGRGWRVAIASPDGPDKSPADVIMLKNASVATSGSYINHFGPTMEENHIIVPESGFSSVFSSVSVIAENCATADALATALGCTSRPQKCLKAFHGTSCMMIDMKGGSYRSQDWMSA